MTTKPTSATPPLNRPMGSKTSSVSLRHFAPKGFEESGPWNVATRQPPPLDGPSALQTDVVGRLTRYVQQLRVSGQRQAPRRSRATPALGHRFASLRLMLGRPERGRSNSARPCPLEQTHLGLDLEDPTHRVVDALHRHSPDSTASVRVAVKRRQSWGTMTMSTPALMHITVAL